MIRYLLECLAFQLIFLLIYDLFLKKETFFQWNRVYLLGTFLLSLVLPWIRVEALKTTVTEKFIGYPLLFQLDELVLYPSNNGLGFWTAISWEYWCYGIGALFMACWFGIKLFKLHSLKRVSEVHHFKDYIKVVVPESKSAFSFFRNIFMGQEIQPEKQEQIIAHELVHVKQWHTLDLVFFEFMRIVFWFNPLVFIYQKRIAELHEFMADAVVSKENKKEQYQSLLSEVFKTQNISFVNQFFNQSLIKKRIVMLTKQKSSSKLKLKYILLFPVVVGMLIYTSCETEASSSTKDTAQSKAQIASLEDIVVDGFLYDLENNVLSMEVESLDRMSENEKKNHEELLNKISTSKVSGKVLMKDKADNSIEILIDEGAISSMSVNKQPGSTMDLKEKTEVPFGVIDEVPVFPGCENSENTKACFMEKINEHIRKNFNYPKTAQEQGIEGKVNVLFRISEDGYVKGINTRGPDKLLEDEVVRIISKLPQMQPGKHEGKVVEVPFSMPIAFKLN